MTTTNWTDEAADQSAPREIPQGSQQDTMADVLASIRALVSAEASARAGERVTEAGEDVVMLTADMRVDAPVRTGEVLAEGIGVAVSKPVAGAPILDEEALRGVINSIVREELQGELGERISRNLHKIVRREISEIMRAEQRND